MLGKILKTALKNNEVIARTKNKKYCLHASTRVPRYSCVLAYPYDSCSVFQPELFYIKKVGNTSRPLLLDCSLDGNVYHC